MENEGEGSKVINPVKINVKQEEIQDLIFSREIGWQDIIYDLTPGTLI